MRKLLFRLSILILFLYLAIRMVDYSQVMYHHPLSNQKHDVYSYLPQLFFLKACGYYEHCSYWYNGFTTFAATPPGWFLIFYPLYLITDSVLITLYVSMVIIFIVGFLLINYFGKKIFDSLSKRLFFIAFLFGNNVAINSLRLGKVHEIMAFFSFVIASLIIFYYKDKKIDKKFFWTIPPYTISLLTYHSVGILLSFLFLGLLLIKKGKEFLQVLSNALISLALTAFWWLPLLINLGRTSIIENKYGVEAWWMFKEFTHFTSLAIIVFPIFLYFLYFFYLKNLKFDRKEILFFTPSMILVLLFFLGVMPFIPVLKQIFTNLYFLFIIFLMLYLFLKLNFDLFSQKIRKAVPYCILVASIVTIGISLVNTPFFDKPTKDQSDVKELFNYINESFLVVGKLNHINSHRAAFYSYAPIYKNLKTPDGHYPVLASKEYVDGLNKIQDTFNAGECEEFKSLIKDYKAEFLLSSGENNCEALNKCGFNIVKQINLACLYRVN